MCARRRCSLTNRIRGQAQYFGVLLGPRNAAGATLRHNTCSS
jgi:hypothetical protein